MTRPTRRLLTSLIAVSAVALGALSISALASTAPGLGTAASYAVLAGQTVTNTGNSVIAGDLGISPGSACTGLPAPCTGGGPGTVSGAIHVSDAQALKAQNDLGAAYGVAFSSPCTSNSLSAWGGQTLTAGTYCQTTSPTISGTLTLSGGGVFIFKTGSTLVTAPGATIHLIGDADPCKVFWQVSSSATLGTTTTFVGTIMALTDIHLNEGASIKGRALARNGEVTLINNKITVPTECAEVSASASPSASASASTSASPSASPTASATASPTATTAPVLATTGGGPSSGVPWILLLLAGFCVAGLGLIVRERVRAA